MFYLTKSVNISSVNNLQYLADPSTTSFLCPSQSEVVNARSDRDVPTYTFNSQFTALTVRLWPRRRSVSGVNLVLFQELNEVPFYYGSGRGAARRSAAARHFMAWRALLNVYVQRWRHALKATDVEQLIFRRPLTRCQSETVCFTTCV